MCSKVNQLYTYPLFFRVFSCVGHYRLLSWVPCAILWVLLVIYFTYSSVYMGLPRWRSWSRTCLPMQKTWETWVWSLGQEDPLEEGTTIRFSVLAWRIPWTQEPGGLQSVASQSRTRLKWLGMHVRVRAVCIYQSCSPQFISSPFPFGDYGLYSASVTINDLWISSFVQFILDFIYKWYHMILVFLWHTSLTMTIFRSIHLAADGIISLFCMAE